jgi:hypothetical protein
VIQARRRQARTQGCIAAKAASCSSRDQALPHPQCPSRSSISASGLQPLKPLAPLLAAKRLSMTSGRTRRLRNTSSVGVCVCACELLM